jgi:cytochrome c1
MGIQYEYARDLPRRVVFDDTIPGERWEEWHCTRCHQWFPSAFVKVIAARRSGNEGWLLDALCARCHRAGPG